MPKSNAIVVVVDRLGAGALGPYGNTWIDTPGCNYLASRSVLFETMQADSVSLDRIYRSYWNGIHAWCPDRCSSESSLPRLLHAAGIHTALLTDSERISQHELAQGFSDRILLQSVVPLPVASPGRLGLDDSSTAQLVARAIEFIQQTPPPFVLWIHAQAMEGMWNAPYSLREQFVDEGDPSPPDFQEPPDFVLEEEYDPDLLLGINYAYAGEVVAVDACLSGLHQAIEECGRMHDTSLILTSPRGYPLGEHGAVGASGDHLFSELLQVPLILKLPEIQPKQRVHDLTQPADIYSTLLALLNLPTEIAGWGSDLLGENQLHPWSGSIVCSGSDAGAAAIRTPAWFLCQLSPQAPRLFAKPGDRWEVNEVADRCADIVLLLQDALTRFRASAEMDDATQISQLDEILIENPDV